MSPFVCILCIILTVAHLEARSLRRRHGHHLHLDQFDPEDPVPRDLPVRGFERFHKRPHEFPRHEKYHRDMLEHSLRTEMRRKRHNGGVSVSVQKMTDKDHEEFLKFKQLNNEWPVSQYFELEVKEAQNRSICNYTVISIPDPTGTRVPRDLEHVRCNYAGKSCYAGSYCCIQTYRNVEVRYGNSASKTMKVYAGCVCALQMYGKLKESKLDISITD